MLKQPLLIGISYCGSHNKGDELGSPGAVMVPPADHATWLLESVLHYDQLGRMLDRPVRVIVSAVGLPCMLHLNAPGERNAIWQVLKHVTVVNWPTNPGHQVGASIAIRQGLECAGCWGYPLYLHTAEDIMPWPGAIEKMLAALDEGADYTGFCWTDMLNCAFFGCRTTALSGTFDMEAVRRYVGIEHYLSDLLKDHPKVITGGQGYYLTTHDFAQYRRWLKKMPESTCPPVVRTMSDYVTHKEYLENE